MSSFGNEMFPNEDTGGGTKVTNQATSHLQLILLHVNKVVNPENNQLMPQVRYKVINLETNQVMFQATNQATSQE